MPSLSPELLALVKKSKNQHTRTGNAVEFKEGKTKIRIVANPDGSQFWADLGVHWIKTEKNGKPVAVVGCRDEVYGEACPICTAIAQATAAATSDEELALIKEWKANKSVIVNAIVRDGASASPDPQVVSLKSSVWGQISGMIAEYAESDIDLLALDGGQDFVIERRGRGQNDTKYTVMLAPKSEKVAPDVATRLVNLKEWIESNFFRGDETKALTAIANVSGVSVLAALAALAAPVRSAMLTKPATIVEDAEVEAAADAIVEAESTDEEVTETDEERELREFREFKAAQAAAAVKAAAKPDPAVAAKAKADAAAAAKLAAEKKEAAAFAASKKAAAATTVSKTTAAADFNADLPKDEIDSLLADLDS